MHLDLHDKLAFMPISTEHAGRTYPPVSYTVTAGKIAEFAAAIGDTNPAYQGGAAIAPPTFAVVLANWDAVLEDPELDVKLTQMLHAEQRFAYARPLRAGDDVTATATIDNVRIRGNVEILTIATRVDSAGEHIATLTSTLFHNRPATAEPTGKEET